MKSNAQLVEEARCRQVTDLEREKSDKCYAKIIVEKIVFGFIIMILTAFAGYLISLIIGSAK